jgi:hypothetical protein
MRRIATPDEIFDLLDDAKGRKFATIGYVTSASFDLPKAKRLNPVTNRMNSYDDYTPLGKHLGYEDGIGGVVKLTSYTMQLSNRKQMNQDYDKYVGDANAIRAKYGLEPMKHSNGYTKTMDYGNGIPVYNGDNETKKGHVYYPANTYDAQIRNTYYVVDKDGSIDREVTKDELKDFLKARKDSISGVATLRKMGAEEEKIQQFISEIGSLKMNYKHFEYSSILYIVGSANGEKYVYINTNLNRAVGDVNVNAQEFAVIVKAKYVDDLSDIPEDTTGAFDSLNEEFTSGEDNAEENGDEMGELPFMQDDDDLKKGMTLMAEALKQYEEGKLDLADHNREEANRFFDKVKENLSTEDGIEKAMYGECRNFGLIYNVIEENASKLYETVDGRNKIGKILNHIKNNDVLLHEFKVYDAFTRPINVVNPDSYVNEAVSVINRYGKKRITEENSKLLKLMKKSGLNENVFITNDTIKLCEAIEYTLLNKPSISNVNEYSKVKSVLKESVERNNREKKECANIDNICESGVKNITEKYSSELNDDEKRLVEEVAGSPKMAEKRFNEIKSSLMSELKARIEESDGVDREGWEHVYETVEKRAFDKNKALDIISDLISLRETIE